MEDRIRKRYVFSMVVKIEVSFSVFFFYVFLFLFVLPVPCFFSGGCIDIAHDLTTVVQIKFELHT